MLSPEWVTGFADGEGCFVLGVYLKGGRRRHNNFTPRFDISQRADGAAVLLELEEYFGVGAAEPRSSSPTSSSPMLHFEVRRLEDFSSVIRHFDAYPLRTRKQRDYLLWKAGILLVQEAHERGAKLTGVPRGRSYLTKKEWTRLHHLHQQLQSHRRYQQP